MRNITVAALASAAILSAGTAVAHQERRFLQGRDQDEGSWKRHLPASSQGGNITAAVGTEGIIVVDSAFAPLHDKIKAAIEKISPLPI